MIKFNDSQSETVAFLVENKEEKQLVSDKTMSMLKKKLTTHLIRSSSQALGVEGVKFKDKDEWNEILSGSNYGWSSQPVVNPRVHRIIWDNDGTGKIIEKKEIKMTSTTSWTYGYFFSINGVSFQLGAFSFMGHELKTEIMKNIKEVIMKLLREKRGNPNERRMHRINEDIRKLREYNSSLRKQHGQQTYVSEQQTYDSEQQATTKNNKKKKNTTKQKQIKTTDVSDKTMSTKRRIRNKK
jgi:hypothetical protein